MDSVDGESMASFLKRKSDTRKRSGIEVVGTKTHEELASDWLAHFEKSRGRPSGGMTPEEMAEKAGVTRQSIERYIRINPTIYTKVRGTKKFDCGERAVTYYVYNG